MRLYQLLKSKIHHARVSYTNPDYIGSIEIDQDLMDRVGMIPGELVHVWDVTNGERFTTYAMPGEPNCIGLNGGAAFKVRVGDTLIIVSFAVSDEPVTPQIILVDENNHYVRDIVPFKRDG